MSDASQQGALRHGGSRVLVTGGAGFIGSHLVDRLLADGHWVTVLDNFVNGKEENIAHHSGDNRFRLVEGNVTDRADVKRAMRNVERVFHLACLGVRHSIKHPTENHLVNAGGTLSVLQMAREVGVGRFVHCSSSEVYGTAHSVPMSEEHVTNPATVYGASKLAGEAYARAYFLTYKMPVTILRPFNTYGPRSHCEGNAGEMIPRSIVMARKGKSPIVYGDGRQTRDFTYVGDTVDAIVKAGQCTALVGRTVNICSGTEWSIQRIARRVCDLSNAPGLKVRHIDARPGDVRRLLGDGTKLRKATGWRPEISMEEGLRRTIDWFASRDLLEARPKDRNWE